MAKRKLPIKKETLTKTLNTENMAKAGSAVMTALPFILMVGGAVAVYFVGKKLVNGITGTAGEAKDFLTKQEQNVSDAVIEKEILKATISKTEARRMAQGLYDSMAEWETDEERIKQIFDRFQNKADFLIVYKEFGLRPYGGIFGDWWGSRKFSSDRNLVYWLKSELSESDVCYEIVKKWVTAAGFGF